MRDVQLFQRATKMAKHLQLIEPAASKVIRALLSAVNEKDRELREWRSGRMATALRKERDSLVSANQYLQEMLRQQRENAS